MSEPLEPAPEHTDERDYSTSTSGPASEERTWGMLCHLLAFSGYVGIPFGNIIGPLVMWLIKKDESDFVDHHGKESLNFQITAFVAGLGLAVLSFALLFVPVLGVLLVIVLFLGLAIACIVLTIIAAVRANAGESYQYPFCIRFLR